MTSSSGTSSQKSLPIETQLTMGFKQHLGPRFRAAELTIEAFPDRGGVTVSCADKGFEQSEYFSAVVIGVVRALEALRITNMRIHIHRATTDDVDSSPQAFETCAFQAVNALVGIRPS